MLYNPPRALAHKIIRIIICELSRGVKFSYMNGRTRGRIEG